MPFIDGIRQTSVLRFLRHMCATSCICVGDTLQTIPLGVSEWLMASQALGHLRRQVHFPLLAYEVNCLALTLLGVLMRYQ